MGLLKKIKNMLKKPQNTKRLIDYRTKTWGHNIEFLETHEDGSFDVYGFNSTFIPRDKDEFLHHFKKGVGVCTLWDVHPCNDPKDMFFAKAGIIRYATEEDYAKLNEKPKSSFNILR